LVKWKEKSEIENTWLNEPDLITKYLNKKIELPYDTKITDFKLTTLASSKIKINRVL
jgi:tRNA G37 N-methylase TrmD